MDEANHPFSNIPVLYIRVNFHDAVHFIRKFQRIGSTIPKPATDFGYILGKVENLFFLL
jgi:hypothetical protein